MNFKALLFHVLGKPIKMLIDLPSSLPQTHFCIGIYLQGLEQGRITRSWGALCPDSTAALWVIKSELIAPRCGEELWLAVGLAL